MESKSIRQIVISSAAYSLSSILGPLLFLGVPAYFIDQYLGTNPLLLLVAVGISFIITNILLFKKVAKINQMISSYIPVEDKVQDGGEVNPEISLKNNKL